jgi:hypothetical protein
LVTYGETQYFPGGNKIGFEDESRIGSKFKGDDNVPNGKATTIRFFMVITKIEFSRSHQLVRNFHRASNNVGITNDGIIPYFYRETI